MRSISGELYRTWCNRNIPSIEGLGREFYWSSFGHNLDLELFFMYQPTWERKVWSIPELLFPPPCLDHTVRCQSLGSGFFYFMGRRLNFIPHSVLAGRTPSAGCARPRVSGSYTLREDSVSERWHSLLWPCLPRHLCWRAGFTQPLLLPLQHLFFLFCPLRP